MKIMQNKLILIQGAMPIEIEYLLSNMNNLEKIEIQGYEFYKGKIEKFPVVISKTNVGLIENAIATYIGITNFNVKGVINQGTAGACSADIHNYDIIVGEKCININSYITKKKEEGQGSFSLDWELLTFKDGKDELVELKADESLLNRAMNCSKLYKKGKVKIGIIGSGDVWDNEIDRIKWFHERYHVLCEDMETISTYTICKKLDVPVIGIRIISDNELTGEKYDKNIAIELQKYVIEIIKELKNM